MPDLQECGTLTPFRDKQSSTDSPVLETKLSPLNEMRAAIDLYLQSLVSDLEHHCERFPQWPRLLRHLRRKRPALSMCFPSAR